MQARWKRPRGPPREFAASATSPCARKPRAAYSRASAPAASRRTPSTARTRHSETVARVVSVRRRRRADGSALDRRGPGGGATADRVVTDALAARGDGVRIPAPSMVEEPRPRVAVAVRLELDGGSDHALDP